MNLLDFIFPKRCVGCHRVGGYFCQNCIASIKQKQLICSRCQRLSVGGQTHPVCKRRFGLDGLWSLGAYQNPLKKAIQKLKYQYVEELSEILVNILVEYWAGNQTFLLDLIKKDQGQNWIVVPVPLHWTRQNWRGFNQAALLGQILSKKLGLGYCDYLKRIRQTKSQVELKGEDRRANIKGAFALSPNPASPAGRSSLITHNILLIDDVWTTGSTIRECCYVLKRGGAKSVWALTLAR